MTTLFYRRSGEQIARKHVRAQRLAYAESRKTGRHGALDVAVNARLAARVESMTDEAFCDWSGAYTWRKIKA